MKDNKNFEQVTLYEIDGVEMFLSGKYIENGKTYAAIFDKNRRQLTPFSTVPFQEYFSNFDKSSWCFTRYNKGKKNYTSYHVLKSENDGEFYLRANITGNKETACRLIQTEKDDYWFVEATTHGIEEFSLYDVRKGKILTPGFSTISFETEKSRVLAYVEKEIYTLVEEEYVLLTVLASFIDRDGNFLAQLYDVENDDVYDTLAHNYDKTFKSFNYAILGIENRLKKQFLRKKEYVENTLNNMFNNIYSEEEIKRYKSKEKAKVLKFPSEVNNDKK